MNGAHVLSRSGARLRPWVPRKLYQRGVPCVPPRLLSVAGSASLPVGPSLRPCGSLGSAGGPCGRKERGAQETSARCASGTCAGVHSRTWAKWFGLCAQTSPPRIPLTPPPPGHCGQDTPAAVVLWQGIHVYTCALSAVGGDAVRAMSVSVSVSV